MNRHWQPLVQLAGRVCLGLVFLSSAAAHLRYFQQASGPASEGLSSVLLGCWILLAVVGGLATALGFRTRCGLAMLALCTLAGLWFGGRPLDESPAGLSPGAAHVALLGAIVALMAAGPGRWSFDAGRTPPAAGQLGDSNVLG